MQHAPQPQQQPHAQGQKQQESQPQPTRKLLTAREKQEQLIIQQWKAMYCTLMRQATELTIQSLPQDENLSKKTPLVPELLFLTLTSLLIS
jgi:hypothetical protein